MTTDTVEDGSNHHRDFRTRRGQGWEEARFLYVAGLLAGVLLVGSDNCWGVESIDTDGPDFVESSESVPQGRLQYEVDLTAARAARRDGAGRSISTPTLLKYGVSPALEIRVAPDGLIFENGRRQWADTAIGVKWHSQDRNAALGLPAVSWILHLQLPTGSSALRGYGVRPSLRGVFTWELPHDLALGVMPGLKVDSSADAQRFTSGILGVVVNKKLSDLDRVFVEASVPQIAKPAYGGSIASIDVGAAHLMDADTQIGIRLSLPANSRAPKSSVAVELAQRF